VSERGGDGASNESIVNKPAQPRRPTSPAALPLPRVRRDDDLLTRPADCAVRWVSISKSQGQTSDKSDVGTRPPSKSFLLAARARLGNRRHHRHCAVAAVLCGGGVGARLRLSADRPARLARRSERAARFTSSRRARLGPACWVASFGRAVHLTPAGWTRRRPEFRDIRYGAGIGLR